MKFSPTHVMKLLIPFLSVCFALPSFAASYYISNSGNDAANGTSTGTPWLTFSNVYPKAFLPGDSILLKAGDTFDGPLRSFRTGALSAPITIDRYGSGANPIIRGDHPNAVWSPVAGHAGVFSTYTGLTPYSSPELVYQTNGVKYTKFNRGVDTLDNWLDTFTNGVWGADSTVNVYIRTLDDNPPPQMYVFEFAVVMANAHYVIQNLEIRNGGKALYIQGPGNKVISNYMHNVYASGVYAGDAWQTEIATNTIAKTAHDQIYMVHGGSNWVHHNLILSNSTVILGNINIPPNDLSGIGLLGGTNNIVEHNTIMYVVAAFVDYYYEQDTEVRYNYGFQSGFAASPTGTGLKVHHNVFNMNNGGPGISVWHAVDAIESPIQTNTGPNLIYNNVISGFTTYGLNVVAAGASNVVLRNNIFVTDKLSAGGSMATFTDGVDSDYNLYYTKTNAPGIAPRWRVGASTFYSSLPLLTAGTGLEANSIYASAFSSTNPMSAGDFALSLGSPAVDTGANLVTAGLIAAPVLDFNLGSVPKGAGWDIGALEFAPPTLGLSGRWGVSGKFSLNP